MSKKLTGNGRWESSRFIMPEHRAAMIKQSIEKNRLRKPELTEEEQEIIFGMLQASLSETLRVTLTLFGEYRYKEETGIVVKIDRHLRSVKLDQGDDWRWIDFDLILSASLE